MAKNKRKIRQAKHKARVAKTKAFFNANKVFTIITAVLIILLCTGFFFSKDEISENNNKQEETSSQVQEDDGMTWRFYPIDGVIALIGVGFCSIMAVRECKKRKEEI